MEEVGLDTKSYSTIMAQTLAALHWAAKIDENDIKFVLGMTAKSAQWGPQAVGMWVLDFNQCSGCENEDVGIKKRVDAFYWNDPYYPWPDFSPDERDRVLWEGFTRAYLEASRVLAGEVEGPKQFIDAVEREGMKRRSSSLKSLFG